jgi:hypothetical protein
MGIRSFLRGILPSFYSAEVLLPLINLEKGLPQTAEEWDSCFLQSLVDVVFVVQWRRSTGVGGGRLTPPWRPAPSTLFLGGWSTTTVHLYAGTAGAGRPLVGIAWTVRHLPTLSSRSTPEHAELA